MNREGRVRLRLMLCALALLVASAIADEPGPKLPELRAELLAMKSADQAARKGFGPNPPEALIQRMREVDARNQARMEAIIEVHGWPGKNLVGENGAEAAWLLVQHAEPEFMERCLPLLKAAMDKGEAPGRHYAYLLDRVRMRQGKPQVYGTQFLFDDEGNLIRHELENPDQVDERRAKVGLGPIAEYERQLREQFGGK